MATIVSTRSIFLRDTVTPLIGGQMSGGTEDDGDDEDANTAVELSR